MLMTDCFNGLHLNIEAYSGWEGIRKGVSGCYKTPLAGLLTPADS